MKNLARRFDNSSLPIALKWSVMIACFVSLIMGLLAWFLINQQETHSREQNRILGRMLVDQLARAASEPLLAQDDLTLNVLVQQEEKDSLILGMQVFDKEAKLRASAGVSAIWDIRNLLQKDAEAAEQLMWQTPTTHAISFYSPIEYQGVTAGLALVTVDRKPLEHRLKVLTQALATTTGGLILLGIMLAFPLAHRLSRPIKQLVEVGDALGKGHGTTAIKGDRKDEIGRMLDTFQHLAEGMETKRRVETAFSRFVSPSIARQVLNRPEGQEIGGVVTHGSVLFCDVVGFTRMSERMPPVEVAALLNQYFKYFSLAAHSCQGTVDKFIGDCIMILFGVPENDDLHGLHAVTCAVLIQQIASHINKLREQQRLPTVQFRIGINSGDMLAGTVGSEERMQYTVVGDVVNLTARLCDLCQPGEILVTRDTLQQQGLAEIPQPQPLGPVRVKGREQPVTPYVIDSTTFAKDTHVHDYLQQIFSTGETA